MAAQIGRRPPTHTWSLTHAACAKKIRTPSGGTEPVAAAQADATAVQKRLWQRQPMSVSPLVSPTLRMLALPAVRLPIAHGVSERLLFLLRTFSSCVLLSVAHGVSPAC